MAVNSVLTPYPVFTDASGVALENGFIYIGQPGFEARTSPKASFFDVAQTIPTGTASGAAIRTRGGMPINTSNSPAMFYVDGDFSISVLDRNGVLLYSALNTTLALNIGGAVGPILAPDGNLGATGFGFVSETNTGLVRSAIGTVQDVVQGVVVATKTTAGTVFNQPISGTGFSVPVLAIAEAKDANILKANTQSTLVAAVVATPEDAGTKSTGSYALSPASGNFKKYINNGAHTLTAPVLAGNYSIVVQITNGASAGAITFSGFARVIGDVLTTTNGHIFQVYTTKTDAGVTASVVAMQ